MDLLEPANPLANNTLLWKLITTFLAEKNTNNWRAITIKDYHNSTAIEIPLLVSSFMSLLPILICSAKVFCPRWKCFEIDLTPSEVLVRLNSSMTISYDPTCLSCGPLVKDGYKDPLRIYLEPNFEGSLFMWQNSTYVSGRKAGLIRYFVSSFGDTILFQRPQTALQKVDILFRGEGTPFHPIAPLKLNMSVVQER